MRMLLAAACGAAGILLACCLALGLAPWVANPDDRVLLVVAHPDDETMFFSPTLIALRRQGVQVYVLCLSAGNAYGEGKVRPKELIEACQALQVPAANVKCVDHSKLQDGMDVHWEAVEVQKQVHEAVQAWQITQVITFDGRGVSGHINHIGTHQGVRQYLSWRAEQGLHNLPCMALATTHLIRKYLGVADLLLSWLLHKPALQHQLVLSTAPWHAWAAVLQHRSQLVWYRWLFMLFSRYTYVNTLHPIDQ